MLLSSSADGIIDNCTESIYLCNCNLDDVGYAIIRVPYFDKLKDMKRFVRSNAASARSNLGRGAHGHLGMIDDGIAYFALTGHHFIHPDRPGLLVVAARTTHHEAACLIKERSEDIRIFCETVGVENSI